MKKTYRNIKILFPASICFFSIIYLILGKKAEYGNDRETRGGIPSNAFRRPAGRILAISDNKGNKGTDRAGEDEGGLEENRPASCNRLPLHGGAGNRGLCDFYLPAAACLRKAVWSRFLDKAFDIFIGVFWGQLLYICGASAGAASIAAVY